MAQQSIPQGPPPSDEEMRLARHFTSMTNALTDMQKDLQDVLNLVGTQRRRIAELDKALDKALEMQSKGLSYTKGDLLNIAVKASLPLETKKKKH